MTEKASHPSRLIHATVTGALLLVSCLLCSCIAVTKRPVAPMEIPAVFSSTGDISSEAKWWLDFHDQNLSDLIDKALADNFTLLIAKDRIEEAQAIARQAGASFYPALDGRGSAATTRNHTAETTRDNFLLELAASYEIDLWGRLRTRRDAAVLDAQATEADYHTAAISLTAEMARTWYQLVQINLQGELLTKQKQTNSKVLELISAQFRAGQTGIADVLQQRQLVESNSSDIATLQADSQLLAHQLAILLGVPPGSAILPLPGQLPDLPPLPDTGIPLDLITKRPDIQSSYMKLKAADNRVASAVADRLPRLSISASISTSGERSGDLFNNWLSSLGANLFGPILDGGQRKTEVEKSESVARQNFYKHGQTILEAIGEVEDALVQENKQLAILTSLETRRELAAETIKHVGNRYRQGAEDYQRVLLALLSHQDLQRNIISTQGRLIEFRIALYRALSGNIPGENMSSNEDDTTTTSNTTRGSMQ